MKAIVRIRGMVDVERDVAETFQRLNLLRKYACVVLVNPAKEQLGMLKKVKDFVAFGDIDDKTFTELIEKRGQLIDKSGNINAKKMVEELKKGKKYKELNLKPFFRLHPPRKGIGTKLHFGIKNGVLGDNKEKINDLIGRML
ncbi:MAG: uL30 family ribosomal protein [Nanoarchaeota archaeon]